MAEITTANGKKYNSVRAYHIAIGQAVRYALNNLREEVKQHMIDFIGSYYDSEFIGSEYYQNTYGLLTSIESDRLIELNIKGNWEQNYEVEVGLNWDELDAHFNGYGEFGTYTDFDGNSFVNSIEENLKRGLDMGVYKYTQRRHSPIDIEGELNRVIDKKLQQVVEKIERDYSAI